MWFFDSPKIVFGEDALSWLEQIQGCKAFIVTDNVIAKLGFLDDVQKKLSAAHITCQAFTEVEPDPCVETVKRCAEKISDFKPDWVVGLGGGSCMDAAKAAWLLYERPDVDLESVNPMETYNLRSKARLIVIPTTAGTGAEATFGVVILDCQLQRKLEIVSHEIMPDIAIIDPLLSSQMPRQLTADVGVDALTHAVEGYSCSWSNDFSDAVCIQAVQNIFQFLPRAVESGGTDPVAREKIAYAATLAGLGINTSHIALAHALGHSSGVIFQLPHGRVTGLCLPYTIEFTTAGGNGRYLGLARSLGLEAENEQQAGRILAQAIRNLLNEIGQPTNFKAAGISENQFYKNLDILCEHAQMDTSIATVRRVPSFQEMKHLFEYAYYGREVDF